MVFLPAFVALLDLLGRSRTLNLTDTVVWLILLALYILYVFFLEVVVRKKPFKKLFKVVLFCLAEGYFYAIEKYFNQEHSFFDSLFTCFKKAYAIQ